MDLRQDERFARALAESYGSVDLAGLRKLAGDLRQSTQETTSSPSWWRQRALTRFNRNYVRVNAEASGAGGDALLAKVDSKLAETGWPPLGRGTVLEAGGGEGCYLPAFSARFQHAVFVDASLCNVLLAAKLAEELGLDNVTCVRADVMRLPFPDGHFDVVHQNGVVEHVPEPTSMVAEARRVRRPDGFYICVSPNRLGITPEPHFGLPLFGVIPPPLRRALIPVVRGIPEGEAGTDPRSLRQLRSFVDQSGEEEVVVFFLPRRLPFTARQTTIRRLVQGVLSTDHLGRVVDFALNRLLLAFMPQHIVIARRRHQAPAATPTDAAVVATSSA